MKDKILNLLERFEPNKEKSPFLYTLYDGIHTFLFVPNHVTKGGVHIRDNMDLKRTMVHVVLMLQLCYLFGTYNIGHQHFLALGEYTGFLEGAHLKLMYGLWQLLPIFVVAHVVGLGIEFFYASKKGHSIEEGFLVSGALIPLIMPPDIPLWILAVSVAFAVIIGKEAFGGTGMNIWNIALLSRVFIFFAYPTVISGDEVWVSGLESTFSGAAVEYGWVHLTLFNGIFDWLGLALFDPHLMVVDGYTGATPLALAFQGGWEAVTDVYTQSQMIWGTIPGSIGETSKPLILIGAIFLGIVGIASWRIMLGMLIGTIFTGVLLNMWGATDFMNVPWYHHIYIGGFLFAMAFMATDPVTAAATNRGKWIYGFLIGFFGIIIRVLNPAYAEGWMLAILFMNTFSPLIDHFVLRKNIQKRLASA